ncbi:Plasmodium vivax Vir protein, putative [Plasmodium vivax]|uniref:Vir protein, putative n=1 Tax=Plasmodium vivax TaxID=5855 RepID=A0A1G4E8J8_PLAVI|nr:Plasmodium vivax Vir protein, putative [Plasmodium vivax]
MTKPETEKTYFDYHGYSKLITDINPSYGFTNEYSKHIEDMAKKLTKNSYQISKTIDLLIVYDTYLRRDHAFSLNHYDNCCRYINFWLNNKFRNTDYDINDNNFSIFKEYTKKIERGSKDHECYSYIEYIDSNIFEKMGKLYKFYDMFDSLQQPPKPWGPSTYCSDLRSLVRLYSDYITSSYVDKNEFFSKKLKDFEHRIEKYLEQNKDKCQGYEFHLKSLKPGTSAKENEHQKGDQEQEHSKEPIELRGQAINSIPSSESGPQVILQSSTDDPFASGLSTVPGKVEPSGDLEVQQTLEEFKSADVVRQGELALLEYSIRPEKPVHQRESTHQGGLIYTRESIYPTELGYPEESQYSGKSGLEARTEQSESGGVLESIQNSLTEVLGSVEPAPVLGVSGGMGALYLLFKYTPVGTFFRGGRVRSQRIPGGFSGPFPGGFPNFQDYEGGYIGYGPTSISSLAE